MTHHRFSERGLGSRPEESRRKRDFVDHCWTKESKLEEIKGG